MPASSLTALFGIEELAPAKLKSLAIVYASSLALIMGVNFIQPALPAMVEQFGITDASLGLVMTSLYRPGDHFGAALWHRCRSLRPASALGGRAAHFFHRWSGGRVRS